MGFRLIPKPLTLDDLEVL